MTPRSTRILSASLIATGTLTLFFACHRFFSIPVQAYLRGVPLPFRAPNTASRSSLADLKMTIDLATEYPNGLSNPWPTQRVEETGSLHHEITGARDWVLRVKEWVRLMRMTQATFEGYTESRIQTVFPPQHPTLAQRTVGLSEKGFVRPLMTSGSARTDRARTFFYPIWPERRLEAGDQWTEVARWTEAWGEWIFEWQGARYWTLKSYLPCPNDEADFCAELTYRTDTRPRLVEAPSWAHGNLKTTGVTGEAFGEGTVLYRFDKRYIATVHENIEASLRIPVTSLEELPDEYRTGRLLTTGKGTLLGRFSGAWTLTTR